MLSLPTRWVYVYYENGKTENVAHQDTLSLSEAKDFKEEWEKFRNMKVVRVDLLSSSGTTVKRYDF